jgi:L-fuculose-phosphate aldolase
MSKGFMKPGDLCKVDYEGKQLAGTRKRSSEILLHLAVYKNRPDVNAVVHCHPPHATAFAVAGVPIPKCVLPEVEVFLGEVPTAIYETPGTQKFAETIVPHLKASNTIILANHGTVTFGPDLEKAYWNSEIIDAYCKILILSRQLGNVNYFTQQQTRELLDLKKRLGYDDVRFSQGEGCDLCGDTSFGRLNTDLVFQTDGRPDGNRLVPSQNGHAPTANDLEQLVQVITERVLESLGAAV